MSGYSLWNITRLVVNELRKRGFFVKCIISDMGPSNQAMWKSAGVVSSR